MVASGVGVESRAGGTRWQWGVEARAIDSGIRACGGVARVADAKGALGMSGRTSFTTGEIEDALRDPEVARTYGEWTRACDELAGRRSDTGASFEAITAASDRAAWAKAAYLREMNRVAESRTGPPVVGTAWQRSFAIYSRRTGIERGLVVLQVRDGGGEPRTNLLTPDEAEALAMALKVEAKVAREIFTKGGC